MQTPANTQQQRIARQRIVDQIFKASTCFFACLVLIILISIIIMLVKGSFLSIQTFGLGFLTDPKWSPGTNEFGGLNAIIGTLFTSFVAMLIAVPVSFGIAVFLTELSPTWLRRPLGTIIELLAGIPSIIYGLIGAFFLAPTLVGFFGGIMDGIGCTQEKIEFGVCQSTWWGAQWFTGDTWEGAASSGTGLLTAGVVLAIMIIPFITSVMRDVFEIVPSVLKESAYGLGSTTWEVVRNIVLPYTKTGVVGGVILGLGRALGETMAVTFIIGGSNSVASTLMETGAFSIFAQGNSIASIIALEFNESTQNALHMSSLVQLALILFLITLVVLSASKFMLIQLSKKEGKKS